MRNHHGGTVTIRKDGAEWCLPADTDCLPAIRAMAPHWGIQILDPTESETTVAKQEKKTMTSRKDAISVAKAFVERGEEITVTKADLYRALEKQAAKIRTASETVEQSFARAVTTDPDGILLWRGYRAAPGDDYRPNAGEPPPKSSYDPVTGQLAGTGCQAMLHC